MHAPAKITFSNGKAINEAFKMFIYENIGKQAFLWTMKTAQGACVEAVAGGVLKKRRTHPVAVSTCDAK